MDIKFTAKLYQSLDMLGASSTVANLPAIPIFLSGSSTIALRTTIDDGAGGVTTDTPLGVWYIYASASENGTYEQVSPSDTELTTVLAKIAAPGDDSVVQDSAIIENVPGRWIKIAYVRTSGGGGDSRVNMEVDVW